MTSIMLTHALKQSLTRAVLGPLAIWINETKMLPKKPTRKSRHFRDIEDPEHMVIQIPASPTYASSEASSSPKELPPTLEEIAHPYFVVPINTHDNLVMTVRPVPKAPRKIWPAWAKAHSLGNDQVFRIKHKNEHVYLKGVWEGEKYFLTCPRIAPVPPGREADAEKNGWGVPIKWDTPTHAVALVKMSIGVPLEACKNSQAYELEYLRGANVWQRVYK